ncbi:hypothetical protein MKX03_008722 [Papaver bracteatum]|nr:hypothetical protein MKX03_008722 [Papaver bracteatum]
MWVINELDGRTSSAHVLFSSRARFNFTGLGGPFVKIVQHQIGLLTSSLKIICKSNASSRNQRRIMISKT